MGKQREAAKGRKERKRVEKGSALMGNKSRHRRRTEESKRWIIALNSRE